jgi:hypothetical protein
MAALFPGMDPVLELPPFWSDFSPKLLTSISNQLLQQLLPKYDVRLEEYLILSEVHQRLNRFRPDATITTSEQAPVGQSSAAMLKPATAELDYPTYDALTQRHLKVIHRETERVVTVLELLSPTNKARGEGGMNAYLDKRAELLTAPCNLVELDLLRGGDRLPMSGELPPGDYFAYVGHVDRKPRCNVIGWPWRVPLPAISIPLLAEDGDATLDLQTVFLAAYLPAYYPQRLPYDRPLAPPLPIDEATWLQQILQSHLSGS